MFWGKQDQIKFLRMTKQLQTTIHFQNFSYRNIGSLIDS